MSLTASVTLAFTEILLILCLKEISNNLNKKTNNISATALFISLTLFVSFGATVAPPSGS